MFEAFVGFGIGLVVFITGYAIGYWQQLKKQVELENKLSEDFQSQMKVAMESLSMLGYSDHEIEQAFAESRNSAKH
ncbi:hypothetical protein F9L16_23580 [Agarivorans sp. B2Z047]|uniref:hypothetical protein n=1 Tax=Agarivorans sp. B2Z047 TaxID=2652721 RepID=UPI00128CBA41|nr:hypothetical protein [Agarivorans sp. B2Z047]MPW31939.1 hypothetical protein [Agarivorans sp. B2Z047]UQN41908.1 hypothetical protein LQZ07_19330 [Agarivorans sp. B2Z047]